jgi:hypothetical protein
MTTTEWKKISTFNKDRIISEIFEIPPKIVTFDVVGSDGFVDKGYTDRRQAEIRALNYTRVVGVGCEIKEVKSYTEFTQSVDLLVDLAIRNDIWLNMDICIVNGFVAYSVLASDRNIYVEDYTSLNDVLSRALLKYKGIIE